MGLVVTIASLCVWSLWGVDLGAGKIDLRNAVNVIAGIDATLLGFLISAGALLYAVANTRLVRNLQRTGHFGRLLRDLFIDAGGFLAALVIAVACLFVSDGPPIQIGTSSLTRLHEAIYVLVFANAIAFQLLIPVGWKMWLVLNNLEPDNPDTLE